ncbi:hypothetical protein [Bradyrhizobium erythrophlei]|jgi:hypothetical protein|uniref:Exopolysaccharide production protein YjbE n=1 Tax=Bradyrhizobium erythrophlei TaxID=1437360 RepID=A0A1M7UCG3_9BRAD|nr:hypothetical protein [Bradyrhizobium erythrophlei]SHN80742.1 hypothetical protein SAMN05444170_4489 [Bradyrhizobium erythrophlei]
MKTANIFFASCAAVVLSANVAQAGPCNTTNNTTNKDAGSGPTVGHTSSTTGTAPSRDTEHPPTSTMNRATGDVATSSQDAQRQMQGKPTAAQEAQGAKVADEGC